MNSSVANSREIARATWIRMFCSGCETRSETGRACQGGGTNARGRERDSGHLASRGNREPDFGEGIDDNADLAVNLAIYGMTR